ncbi:MAG: MerR family transcriptional regulator [Bacilli bacterium]|nr:MerR family transcriptional regulator [Bacilli bacterium]
MTEYTINQLARLAGVSTRTLRYYDQINLLKPAYINQSGYRVYRTQEVDKLHTILLYKELGFELSQIKAIISDPKFDLEQALLMHLELLKQRRLQTEKLIQNVQLTLQSLKGELNMTDKEKFQAFLKEKVAENEAKFGAEVRAKYGDQKVDESNAQLLNMTFEEYQTSEALNKALFAKLKVALITNNPQSKEGLEIAQMHAQWLNYYWPKDHYDLDKHVALAQMYLADERFKAFYDPIGAGAIQYLHDAILYYAESKRTQKNR